MKTEEAREEIRKLMYKIAVDATGLNDAQHWDEIRKIAKKQRDKLQKPPTSSFVDADAVVLTGPLQKEWTAYRATHPSCRLLLNTNEAAKPYAVCQSPLRSDILFEDQRGLFSWFHRNDSPGETT